MRLVGAAGRIQQATYDTRTCTAQPRSQYVLFYFVNCRDHAGVLLAYHNLERRNEESR